jgi:PadR family transcriptional regulator, regulatory protein PadR
VGGDDAGGEEVGGEGVTGSAEIGSGVLPGIPAAALDATDASGAGAAAPGLSKFQKELSAGIVSLVLLALLERAQEPLYGYQIAKTLEGASVDGLPLKQGTLYPVLRSLEVGELLASRVEPSVSGPPRRYYSITPLGREALPHWKRAWSRTRGLVDAVLEGHLG